MNIMQIVFNGLIKLHMSPGRFHYVSIHYTNIYILYLMTAGLTIETLNYTAWIANLENLKSFVPLEQKDYH